MLRAQLLLVALSAVLFELLRSLGVLAYSAVPFFGCPSLANLLGGLVFGFGMVLAGGCVVGVLYRAGSGSRLALVALAGLLVGSALYAEMHAWWSPLTRDWRLSDVGTLAQLTGTPHGFWVTLLAVLAAWLWRRSAAESRCAASAGLKGYLPLHYAALGLAVCGGVSLLWVGIPLGVTTSYAKLASWLEQLVAPEHVASLDFFSRLPMTYTPPFSGRVLAGGSGPRLDAVALIQFPLILGIIAGAAFSAYRLKEFRGRFLPPMRQVTIVFAGGVIMGMGARLTPGCNVWHIWGGLPFLALSSLLFLVGLIPGAWLGTQVITRVVFSSQREEP